MPRAARKYSTRQLEQVFRAPQGDSTHPFADLATLYRNLHRLVEDGKIRTVLLGERVVRYDPETSDHDHFACERCGRVIDLFLGPDRRIHLPVLANDGHVETTHSLTVHGRVGFVPRDVRPPSVRARRHEDASVPTYRQTDRQPDRQPAVIRE